MAEAIAAAASVVAIIQISEQVIVACKTYIENVRDFPSHLRHVLVEASMLKTVFETLSYLNSRNDGVSDIVGKLSGENGPIEACRRSLTALEALFPLDSIQTTGDARSRQQRIKVSLAALAWPLKENKARRLLDEIARYKTTITLAITTSSIEDIKDIKTRTQEIQEALTAGERREVYKWLQSTDPSPLHHSAQKNYLQGTGNWILRSPDWVNWLDATRRCLWIHGIPGAGKTVLMSYLIEQIQQYCDESPRNVTSVYYYCYFGHNQDEAPPFLRWLVCQLCRKARTVPSNVYTMYQSGGEPSLVELLAALADIIDRFDVVYFIIDALDESIPREDLLKVIRDILTDPRFSKLQVLASSREYIDIEMVLEKLSIPVSMANSYVEDDIRLYVRSALQSDPKFRQWPRELLDETEDAVSVGAEGMFRWAVCQIDALRKMKQDRMIIKRALANLPKTLDETYGRIFLAIPEEERMFVLQVLQWIYYHGELYQGEGIPATILLQGLEKSTATLMPYQNERHYDIETLQELCGCLVSVTDESWRNLLGEIFYTTIAISFAHYTVREYLDSTRSSGKPKFYSKTLTESLNKTIVEMVIHEGHNIALDLWSWDGAPTQGNTAYATKETFNGYCVSSALLSLRRWPSEIAQQDELYKAAVDLLNPSRPNYHRLKSAALHIEHNLGYFSDASWYERSHFWNVDWKSPPSNPVVVQLLNLLFLAHYSKEVFILAERLLSETELQDVLVSTFELRVDIEDIDPGNYTATQYSLHGNIVEVFAQLADSRSTEFGKLLNYASGLCNPSNVLILHIGAHEHNYGGESQNCHVERLLRMGADPNNKSYCVTPLQIAVASWDFDGVSILLAAKADPNDTGHSEGIVWEEDALMSRFNHLHNLSPLHICRNVECVFKGDTREGRKKNVGKIEQILLQYGAEEYTR